MAWEHKESVVILVPHQGSVSTEWALSFMNLIKPHGTKYVFLRGVPLPEARTMLIRDALKSKAQYFLFLDSDIIPPVNGLMMLLEHNLPFVSGIYRTRKSEGFMLSAWVNNMPIDYKQDARLVEVEWVGLGFCLMRRDIFDKVKEPYFKWSFGIEEGGMSEDAFFCSRVREAGYKIIVDMECQCSHLGNLKILPDGNITTMGV
jgi:hypothetical protein